MGAKDRLRRLPIRAKLTLAYTAAIAVVLSGIGLFLYANFESGLDASLNTTLNARADDVAAVVRQEGVAGLRRHRALLVGGDLATQVLDPQGRVLFSTSSVDRGPLVSPARVRAARAGNLYIDREERERFLVRRNPGGRSVLVVRASLEQRERALELLSGALLVGGGLTLVVAAFAGYALARAVVRPMEAMREAAAAISDVDPGARLPLPPAEDEVHRLGVTLNGMLARLEHARDREREFFSDASHELRTPLTILKTEVEIALRHGSGGVGIVARANNGHVELHVIDDGPGIPPGFLPHAFERFSRARTGRTGDGTGLGLTIVQLIAQAHGGRAGIANRPSGGADAWLELPIGPGQRSG